MDFFTYSIEAPAQAERIARAGNRPVFPYCTGLLALFRYLPDPGPAVRDIVLRE